MNQRLDLAVALGAIFLAIFVVTTAILLTLRLSEREPETSQVSVDDADYSLSRPEQRPEDRRIDRRADRAEDRAGTFVPPDLDPSRLRWRDDRNYGYGAVPDQGSTFGGYRFRPLEEGELRRFEASSAAREDRSSDWSGGWTSDRSADLSTGRPDDRSRGWPADGSARGDRGLEDPVFSEDPWLPDNATSDWGTTPYRFRPTDPPRAEPGSRRPTQPPRVPRGSMAPGLFGPPPQWGATPFESPPPWPDLYPSLVSPNEHRLTVN
jgi:hypothetical protein